MVYMVASFPGDSLSFSAVSGGPVTWQPLEFLPLALCDLILLINCSPSALRSLVADTPVLFWISKANNRTSLKVCLTQKQILGETPWVKTRDFGTSFRIVRHLVTFPPFPLPVSKKVRWWEGRVWVADCQT